MAKRKSQVPKEETAAQRFKRVIEPRVGKALKAIRLVGSVSGSTYSYTERDVANIVTALRDAVDGVEQRFSSKAPTTDGFTLR